MALATTPLTSSSTTRRADGAPDVVTEFLELRPRLLGIAQRILGSRAEAEDVVQDAWLRWQAYDREAVQSATAFLVTTTTRLALNTTASARVRREAHVGTRVPHPVDPGDDPATDAERREAVERGLCLLLERLGPAERAAFLLRRSFGHPYPRLAALLGTTEVNARQLVSRAGRRLATADGRVVPGGELRRLVLAYSRAAREGDLAVLEALLVRDLPSGDVPSGPSVGLVAGPRAA